MDQVQQAALEYAGAEDSGSVIKHLKAIEKMVEANCQFTYTNGTQSSPPAVVYSTHSQQIQRQL
jgi:hypothetical protein